MKWLIDKILPVLIVIGTLFGHVHAVEISLINIWDKPEDGAVSHIFYDCGGHKETIFIKENETPAISVPLDEIKNVQIMHYICEGFYQPFDIDVTVSKPYAERLRKLYVENVGKRFMEYVDDEMVSILHIVEPTGTFDIGFGCLTLEKAVALTNNLGFQPHYDSLCINGKKEVSDLSIAYRFKEKRSGHKNESSVLWTISKRVDLLNNLKDKTLILKIPVKSIVEQYFNDTKKEFERSGNHIRVVYQGKVGWIDSGAVVPFLTTLDNNTFLQKFFENHEQFYQSKLIAKEAVAKRKAIRDIYIEEALNRFSNEDEFRRWYLATFRRPFSR